MTPIAVRAAVLAMTVLLLVACAGRKATPTTTYGEDALTLILRVPNCVHPQRVISGTGAPASVTSTCMLGAHHLVLYTWPDANSENDSLRLLASEPPGYSASGIGWTALVGDRAPLPTQRSIVQSVARALHGRVVLNP
jgi:hypothetical protein